MSGQKNTMCHSIILQKLEVDNIFQAEIIWTILIFTIYMYHMNTDDLFIGGTYIMINGIIIQRNQIGRYKGVEGDNWYLNDKYPELFEEYFCENIEKSWYDSDYVDVCTDIHFVEKYIELSRLNHIKFRVLLCETEKEKPNIQNMVWKTRFIGYDYAYLGGSYYSAVLNDICSGRIEQFKDYILNSNGLFDNITDLKDFISKREHYKRQYGNQLIEEGDFVIYKLYEIVLDEGDIV